MQTTLPGKGPANKSEPRALRVGALSTSTKIRPHSAWAGKDVRIGSTGAQTHLILHRLGLESIAVAPKYGCHLVRDCAYPGSPDS